LKQLALVAGVLASSVAWAGVPLITDDPDTLDKGHWEINIAYTLDVSASMGSGGRTWDHGAPQADLNYGLFDNTQLNFQVPLEILDPAGGTGTRVGIGDAQLGCKLRLIDGEKAPIALSVYPRVGIPSGDEWRGLGTGSPSLTLPVQIGQHLLDGKLFLYADFGYEEEFAHAQPDSWFGGVAAEYAISDRFTLCGEVRYEHRLHGEAGSVDDSLFNVGGKWKLGETVSLIGTIGRSFDPKPNAGSSLLGYIGLQFSF
jgi:hypothetical protein